MLKLLFSLSIIFLYSTHSYALSKDEIVGGSINALNFVAEKLFGKSTNYGQTYESDKPADNMSTDNTSVDNMSADNMSVDNLSVENIDSVNQVVTDNKTLDNQTAINDAELLKIEEAIKEENRLKEEADAKTKADEKAKADAKNKADAKAKADAKNKANNKNKTYIANIFTEDVNDFKIIISNRTNNEVSIYQINNDKLNSLSSFSAIYGSSNGDKIFRGDNKTPEGVYYITNYIDEKTLIRKYGSYAPVYGEGAFPLDYPNPIDKSERKTGGGIWLHGNSVDAKDITQGCVAFNNKDLTTIKQHVGVSTPVILTDDIIYTTKEEYDKEKAKLISFAHTFINDKLKLSNNKNAINNLKIFTDNGDDYVIDFNVDSCENGNILYNNIKYYFSNNGNSLKLIDEKITSLKVDGTKYKEIEEFANKWAAAWQSQNINKYIAYYSEKFRSGNRNFQQLKKYKTVIFKRNNGQPVNVKVDVKKIWISNGRIFVQLKQQYSSKHIKNTGYKTLQLIGCNGDYSIVKESWNRL